MQIIRLTTCIHAPAERCFGLATSTEFHSVLAALAEKRAQEQQEHHELGVGDRLMWPGHYLGLQLRYTTRISLMRPYDFFREVLETGSFRHFEHDHHFTPLNGGTRMRDEIRFVIPPGLLGPMTTPLVRRYIMWRISMRNSLLRQTAQSELWKHYVEPNPAWQDGGQPEHLQVRSDAAARVSAGQMAAHGGGA